MGCDVYDPLFQPTGTDNLAAPICIPRREVTERCRDPRGSWRKNLCGCAASDPVETHLGRRCSRPGRGANTGAVAALREVCLCRVRDRGCPVAEDTDPPTGADTARDGERSRRRRLLVRSVGRACGRLLLDW